MKRVIISMVILVVLVIVAVACGASKTCPAYGMNQTEEVSSPNS